MHLIKICVYGKSTIIQTNVKVVRAENTELVTIQKLNDRLI